VSAISERIGYRGGGDGEVDAVRLWLDDERPPPRGWELRRWPQEVIRDLEKFHVQEVSLDHDLGDDEVGTGYDVLAFIERELAEGRMDRSPRIHIHTANPAARQRMIAARDSIERLQRMLDGAHE
jgi:hypothetical protein